MKRKVAKLRLSPNEEARIIREEHERRRKLRIQQVREQQRYISLQICREVERRRQCELEQLEKDLREDWERQQRDKLHTLQTLYQESLQLLGQGHMSAKENEPDLEAIAQREEENNVKAEERYREAMKELKTQRLKDHEGQSRSTMARKKALQTEKERSAKVASLPKPPPHPIQSIDFKKPHVVKKSDVSAFAATHYHMPDSTVDREADTEQPSAHEGAELEVRRLQDLKKEEMRRREEQLEKARLRGKQALRREHLEQDRERLLVELEHMQQTDLLRRRQQVFQMPAQIFQPLYKRQETAEDYQREMEFAFEDMYTGERRVKGDLVVQLVPEPLPALSTGSQDQELDVTQDEIPPQGAGTTQYDPEQETSVQVEPSKPAPRQALRKLLDRIRNQRNHWTEQNSVPAAEPPTSITDQIPERDTTIDTGSLSSEETHSLEPAPSPPELKTTEPPAAAETQLPDGLANRIKQFEEERKKRDEELEREKQQQVVLLQELEEQKAKLEQMLLEAQQEREELKAAVTQEAPINQPEVPVHEQEAPSVPPELVPPAGEDEHARRIREYQQRLLQQNSLHQRSVEVARQRLEEYQRALRIRYNMIPTSLLPAAVPPGLFPPPLHGVQSVHPPAPLQLPTPPASQAYIHAKAQTPVEVPTRESDMLASHSQPPSSNISSASKLMPDEVEYISSNPRNQKFTAWLTDNIMERVTGHLTERVRATRHSASITLQPTSDPIQGSSSIITSGAPLAPVPETVRPVTLPHCSLRTGSLSSTEDDRMERQRRELQDVQRRELQDVQRRELQDVQRRELQEVQRRELQEVQRRELQDVQRPELQDVQRRELQDVQRRELQDVQRPELQDVQRRELQDVQRRELQDVQRRELQDVQRRELQDVQRRELQEVQRRELQEVQRPELQDVQRRELQDVQRRELQDVQRRELQDVQRPELQDVQRPELQDVQRPELQDVQRRELQEVQRRELQDVQRRELQELQRRELQDVQRRELQDVQRRELQDVQRRELQELQRRELQEVQRRELQEVQRRELQELQRRELQELQRRELQELQRRELQEVQRPELQEVQRPELQDVQRPELQDVQRPELQEVQRRELQDVQRRELQDVQRRLLEQREGVALQQRQQEEERRQQEVEMEQMRRQKETLQALIQTEEQPLPEAARGVLDSESIRQTRLKLLASLLRAIEETNGGTLSHLEDPLMAQSDAPAAPASAPPPGLLPPPRAAKPPVTRVRLSIMEMMTEQHELSAIQEVETSVNTSQSKGPESSVPAPSHSLRWDLQEDYEASVVSDSSGQQTASSPETNSSTSSHILWRERLLVGAGTSPESSESDSILRIISPPSSDSGRGADFSGPGITSCRSPTESANRPPDSDCLSSTTISTGSYISTDPEQNISTDECPLLRRCVEPEHGADSLHVFSPPGQSVCFKDRSPADRPALSVGSLFNDSSIQHIIDKYTQELNISLSTAGRTTDSEGSYVEESGSSVSQLSLLGVPERRGGSESSTSPQSLPSDWAAAQRRGLECHTAVPPVLEPLSGEEPSPAEDHEQDSFRPLIGQLTDQSSCLAADHMDSAMEQLVGQPSAHSSMIGQLPGPISTSFDHGGWDSTLSRMIGRLSHQSSSHWLSGGQNFYAGQLMGRVPLEQSAAWSEEGLEGSGMRPLVGELDESAGRQGASSDERTHADLGVSTEASVPPSYPVFPPEAWPHSASPPGVSPLQQTLLIQAASPPDRGPERTEDSFHPLLAEVPHNETADPSMTFHLPDHHVPSCIDGRPHSRGEESEASSDPSVESEPSPERLRAEQPASCRAAPPLHGSFSQLITSQCHPHESEEELTALAICDDSLTVGEADKGRNSISVRGGDSVPLSDLSEGILEAAREKGILDQSEITLVSLADTTLQDHDTTEEDPHPGGGTEGGEEGQPTEGPRSTLSLNDPPEDNNQTHPDSQCGPGRGGDGGPAAEAQSPAAEILPQSGGDQGQKGSSQGET
ncbi:plectin isoform X2 [Gymnodraco acuticeps]|uniref:Plectin isoform X2 n=1 Tax=Gymnodraco acuticeps TaxID=8218 RepID=A0A6P8VWE7_GYMAC|nr:plectin isoform X2 [Gymnodraco acuticeps]